MNERLAGAAALLAGALLPGAFAPFGLWPLAVLAPAALLALTRSAAPRTVAWRSWLFGLGLFGTGTSWVYVSIHDYGYAPVPLAAGLTLLWSMGLALLPALGGWLWARWLRAAPGGVLLGFPAAWILGEWLRSWLLTGFPWLYLGYSQVDGPLSGWTPIAGVLGTGLLLAFTAAALCCIDWRRLRPRLLFASVLAAWAAGPLLDRIAWVQPTGERLGVALVQGNVPQELKWEPGHLENILAMYAQLSEPLWGTDLVVWPEAAIPSYLDLQIDYVGTQAARARAAGTTLLLGIPTRDSDPAAPRGYDTFNSLIAVGADSGLYHKRHLVPFGEYVPLEDWLRGLIAFFDLPMSDFASGPADQRPLRVKGHALAPFICYEVVFPDFVAAALPAADVLLTVSNDTWFGASLGPLQHMQMARMRAQETGRPLVRGTNNGISALVDHTGRVLVQGGQFTREVIRGEIALVTGTTPFARFGSGPVLLLCALAVAACAIGGARRRSG